MTRTPLVNPKTAAIARAIMDELDALRSELAMRSQYRLEAMMSGLDVVEEYAAIQRRRAHQARDRDAEERWTRRLLINQAARLALESLSLELYPDLWGCEREEERN